MASQTSWMIITILALPISYVASRYARDQRWVQQGVVVGIWVAYLGSLKVDPQSYCSSEMMITSVLVFILPLKLSQQILFDNNNNDKGESSSSSSKKDAGTDDQKQQQPIWKDFLGFVGSFLYYAIPISKCKQTPNNNNKEWKPILLRTMEYLLVGSFKIIMMPILDAYSRQLVVSANNMHPNDNDNDNSNFNYTDVVYWELLLLFSGSVIAGTFVLDFQCAMVHLLSGGKYQQLSMNNYPLLSTSVSEFWSHRYNCLIHCLLKETIYVPLRHQLQYSTTTASFAAFAVSGTLHSWVAYYTFGGGISRACLFFILQVPWIILVERRQAFYRRHTPKIFQRVLTFAFLLGTLPLYVGLFVENMPLWLEKNDPQVPRVPGLVDISQHCMNLLNIDPQYHWR